MAVHRETLSIYKAAERARRNPDYLRQLCQGGVIEAEKDEGGRWRVFCDSVDAYLAARDTDRSGSSTAVN